MSDLSKLSCCVRDSGLFVHIAQCMAEKFGKVYYCGPSEKVMCKLEDSIIGDGFKGITRIDSLWDVEDECDVFVFPDTGFAAEQKKLVREGRPVFGHHGADELEWNKGLFLETLEELGMAVPPHEVIEGLDKLRDYLKDKEDLYIKISKYRGDWETFHWRNWTLDRAHLDCAAYRLGPVANLITFYVFDKIDSKVEDGIDTICIDGNWPNRVLHAMECKDKSLLGAMQDMADISEEIRGVNETFGPKLAEYGYRGPFSTEVRLADEVYFIDPTCRFGSPPSQLQTKLITNLPEMVYAAANGQIVEPESEHDFGAQVLITTDREKEEWCSFDMPTELKDWVRAAFSCNVDGVFTIAPNILENWAGWLIATGDTIEEVIDTLKERKELLPAGFDVDLSSLCELLKELEDAKDEGVEITDQKAPEPATVIED